MFEDAELGHTVDKESFDARVPALRAELLEAQFALKDLKKFPVVLLAGGVEGGGRGETVNALTSWLDPRHVEVNGLGDPSDEELERPRMWRFWRALPPNGKIGIFFGSWYTYPILQTALSRRGVRWAKLDKRIAEIVRFERMLSEEGALVLKFWFHLSEDAQRKRIKELKKDPRTRWRVTGIDEDYFARYDRFREVSERTLRHTSTALAPWLVVEGVDRRYRELFVAEELLRALRTRLAAPLSRAQTWTIDTRGKSRVVVEFDYVANVLALNQAKITGTYAFFTGTQLFLEPAGHRDATSLVRFVVPPGWRIASAPQRSSAPLSPVRPPAPWRATCRRSPSSP